LFPPVINGVKYPKPTEYKSVGNVMNETFLFFNLFKSFSKEKLYLFFENSMAEFNIFSSVQFSFA
jgi:hypothetical protein